MFLGSHWRLMWGQNVLKTSCSGHLKLQAHLPGNTDGSSGHASGPWVLQNHRMVVFGLKNIHFHPLAMGRDLFHWDSAPKMQRLSLQKWLPENYWIPVMLLNSNKSHKGSSRTCSSRVTFLMLMQSHKLLAPGTEVEVRPTIACSIISVLYCYLLLY